MEKRPLSFKPTDTEQEYIDTNNIEWSKYCHEHLEKDIKNKKYIKLEKIQTSIMSILLGLFIIGIMITLYLVIPLLYAIALYISSSICIGTGTIIILKEVFYARK